MPTYRQMLRTLAGLLDKAMLDKDLLDKDLLDKDLRQRPAEAAEALLAARLAPDMHPLASQIRFAAYQAQEAVHRLKGQALPERLRRIADEGWDARERPGTLADAQARITEALACLDDLEPGALDAGAGLAIALDLPGGLAFDLTGEQYARDWALPQFYFHVVSAYAILRNQGLTIGKADYVPHMLAYLRPGASALT